MRCRWDRACVSLVWSPCEGWAIRRSDHLPSMVIVRSEGFTNDQWPMAGSSLLTTRYPEAGWFQGDPSGVVRDPGCRREGVPVELSAARNLRATRSIICG